MAANFSKTLKIKAFSASYSEALLNKSIVILANQSILFGKWWDFRGENTGQKFVATEKRILTPSGRLQQVAALVYRYEAHELQILVITSRGTGRWIIPKGWPQVGRTLADTAAREAYEEAGVRGEISSQPIGSFDYCKMTCHLSASTSLRLQSMRCTLSNARKIGRNANNAFANGFHPVKQLRVWMKLT